jgi:hypothetical protein
MFLRGGSAEAKDKKLSILIKPGNLPIWHFNRKKEKKHTKLKRINAILIFTH